MAGTRQARGPISKGPARQNLGGAYSDWSASRLQARVPELGASRSMARSRRVISRGRRTTPGTPAQDMRSADSAVSEVRPGRYRASGARPHSAPRRQLVPGRSTADWSHHVRMRWPSICPSSGSGDTTSSLPPDWGALDTPRDFVRASSALFCSGLASCCEARGSSFSIERCHSGDAELEEPGVFDHVIYNPEAAERCLQAPADRLGEPTAKPLSISAGTTSPSGPTLRFRCAPGPARRGERGREA